MKDRECTLIRDLLPLYKDNAVSGESKEIISAHLENCEECKTEFDALETAIPEIDDTPDTAESFSRLMKRQKIKKFFTIVLATIVSVAVIFGGWFVLTDFTIASVPAKDIEVVRAFRFEDEYNRKKFFVMYKSPIYSITTTRRYMTTGTGPADEETGLISMVINERRPILSGFKTDEYIEDVMIVDAESLYGEIDVLKFGDKVIWTEEENGDDPVPEYVYAYDSYLGKGLGTTWVADFEQGFVGIAAEGGAFTHWDLDGNVIE